MKRLSLIISALLRVAACVVCLVLTIALYVPYTVVCSLPTLFESLCSYDNWEMFEALMHDITYKPFQQYDLALHRSVKSKEWCDGYDAARKQLRSREANQKS